MSLPPGKYPFIDRVYDLADMSFSEAPADLEELLKKTARENGVEILRDVPVELRCRSEEWPEAGFLVYWPTGADCMHVLVPRRFAKGRA